MRLYIDNIEANIDAKTNVSISLSIASLTEIELSRTGYAKTITIPMTDLNRRVMGDSEQLNSPTMFNQLDHTARIEVDGCTVIEGVPYLVSCSGITPENGAGEYKISIIGSGKEWVKYAIQTPLRALQMGYSQKITPAMILQSWTNTSPVKFLPVERDKFAVQNIKENLFPPVKVLTFEDYHPFLHIKSMLKGLFDSAGYTISSEFINSEYFNSLYMSGNYPKKNADALRAYMDFKAGRFADITATADSVGRVYADPNIGYSTLGNIVESADPRESVGGVTLEGVFSNGGMFQKQGNRVVFIPETEVTIGIEYSILYTTDYYMQSRQELKGFNSINLEDGPFREYKIANRNKDRRDEFRGDKNFMLIIFAHSNAYTYQLTYDEVTNPSADINNLQPSDFVTRTYGIITARTQSITVSTSNRVTNPQLWNKPTSAMPFTPYKGDWALYDGYIKERGEVDVEVKVRSAAEKITPGNPKYFDPIFFGGADPGMKFTLRKQTTIRPTFTEYPGEGSTVDFTQVAAHEMSALDMINSLKHLFNLWFYTDNMSRTVFIEPNDSFHKNDVVVDWSDKIDLDRPIVVSELGADMAQSMVFEYARGDGAVMRWNEQNRDTLGRWSAKIANKFARESERTYTNPVFTASLSDSGSYPDAPAASIIQAGDRDKDSVETSDSLNFPPKIVHFLGMRSLPSGQRWGWPSNGTTYPLLAFHHTIGSSSTSAVTHYNNISLDEMYKYGVSLCFESRQHIKGLHTFYDNNIELYNSSKRVEVHLNLTPQDVEPIIHLNRLMRDFRALYRLTIDGENALYRLEQVCDYNPASAASTKCVFVKYIR